jgi:RNA polymerase sigma-70 factor (ECF subfamily)
MANRADVTTSQEPLSDEAEDVMQDAHVRAYEHLDQFAGKAKFSTWLTRIAVHEALARQHRGNRCQELEPTSEREGDPMDRFASLAPDPEQQASDSEVRRLLEEAVERSRSCRTLTEPFSCCAT